MPLYPRQLFFRHKTAQGREDRTERSGARERAQRRRVHSGASRRRRVQRQRFGIGERVRQRGMGRAGEQSGVTQLPVIRRRYCLLGKRLMINSFQCSDPNVFRRSSEPIYFVSHFVSMADISLSRNQRNARTFETLCIQSSEFLGLDRSKS